MAAHLSLYEDHLSDGAQLRLAAAARMLFVVHGSVLETNRELGEGEAFHAEGALTVIAGNAGATVWRWDFTAGGGTATRGEGARSVEKLSAPLPTLPAGELLMRGDSVSFPPGGCALTHVHQGPGIRCLLEGGIRIDTHGRSTAYGPGGAWFESGPDPVFAQAASDRPSRFIRVMILPRALLGKSSIRYVDEADAARPKQQSYKIFVDAPIGCVPS